MRLFDKWSVPLPAIPDVNNLGLYLDAPLDPEEKIPISDLEWRGLLQPGASLVEYFCSPEDLGILFTKNDDETAEFIWPDVHVAIRRTPPDSAGSDASFLSFWDNNILYILRACTCLRNPVWIRDGGQGADSFEPDFGLLLRSACVFRGEEAEPMFTGSILVKSLGG